MTSDTRCYNARSAHPDERGCARGVLLITGRALPAGGVEACPSHVGYLVDLAAPELYYTVTVVAGEDRG